MATNYEEVDEDKNVPEYNVSKKVTVNELLTMDQQDESLRKYKEALLGQASQEVFARMCRTCLRLPLVALHSARTNSLVVTASNDPRRVVIEEMKVICEGRPAGDIVYKLESKEALDKMKDDAFVLKEGCNYKIQVTFRVQHEIVSGLKYVNTVYRKGVRGKQNMTITALSLPFYSCPFRTHAFNRLFVSSSASATLHAPPSLFSSPLVLSSLLQLPRRRP